MPLPSRPFEQLGVGDSFATGRRTVTAADVASFAAQTGNFHRDEVGSASTAPAFGSREAPGLLTLSYAFGLAQPDPRYVLGLTAMTDVVFTRPVRVGDAIEASGRVSSLSPRNAETGLAGITLVTSNQLGKTVCRARIQVLWRRGDR